MKRKKVVKKLMGYGVSRNKANQMLTYCRLWGFPNRVAIGIYRVSHLVTMVAMLPKEFLSSRGVDFSYSTEENK